MTKNRVDKESINTQIGEYAAASGRYKLYAKFLQKILTKVSDRCAPQAILQSRAKTIPSFAEKIQRKNYSDPMTQITDLCGARVITHTLDEVKAVCDFIEKGDCFEVDWPNSSDVSKRLKATEFGYLSVHYIVQLKRDAFPSDEFDIELPQEVFPDDQCAMKAEIQVRTVLQHAWADFSHDRSYKSAFAIPKEWQRELARWAATLEEADRAFSTVKERLEAYAASYGTYMTHDEMEAEIETLELVLSHSPQDAELAQRIGKLHITLGNWQKAIDVLSPCSEAGCQPAIRDLGIALCKLYRKDPKNKSKFKLGQKYLETACKPPSKDVDAFASLGGAWKDIDDHKAKEYYRKALEIDPFDPYPLGNYLDYEIAERKDTSPAQFMNAAINGAIQRCQDQISVGMNMPWAFYNIAKFNLLLGKPFESIAAYAKAIQMSTHSWMLETSLHSISKLGVVQRQLLGYECVQRFLLLGLAAKFSTPEGIQKVKQLGQTTSEKKPERIVIIAGGCAPDVQQQMLGYREMLLEAFRAFEGTIVAGGTTSGVSGLVGDLQEHYGDSIQTIGYLPKRRLGKASPDKRYTELRYVAGEDFSVLGPLQNWTDLIAAGVKPSQVKLLGINGGDIAAAEYRIALALGARVVIVQDSGREAGKLLADKDWAGSENLAALPADPMIIKAFLEAGHWKSEHRETIAQAVHQAYRESRLKEKASKDEELADWDKLPEHLKESNRQQADDIEQKLHHIGCSVQKTAGRKVFKFTRKEIEILAQMEHARWFVERITDGWTLGKEKDVLKKTSPYLIPWSELPDEIKERDREPVRKIPEYLASVGLMVCHNIAS